MCVSTCLWVRVSVPVFPHLFACASFLERYKSQAPSNWGRYWGGLGLARCLQPLHHLLRTDGTDGTDGTDRCCSNCNGLVLQMKGILAFLSHHTQSENPKNPLAYIFYLSGDQDYCTQWVRKRYRQKLNDNVSIQPLKLVVWPGFLFLSFKHNNRICLINWEVRKNLWLRTRWHISWSRAWLFCRALPGSVCTAWRLTPPRGLRGCSLLTKSKCSEEPDDSGIISQASRDHAIPLIW